MKLKYYALLTSALTSVACAGGALAQTTTTSAPAATADTTQDVVVVGIRKSLQKSLALKRKNSAQVDVITAEDVGKFPDTNVAEALSRVPGVTVDHAGGGGEGNKVAILGVDSRLINVSLDGNPLATSNTGNAENYSDTGRSFNFTNLAPELIGNVEVYKSTQARLDEGAIGGSIIVNTRRPLDLPANTSSISLNYNKNVRTGTSDPRGSIFYSWRNSNHTFGILGTIAYNKQELGGTSISVLSGYAKPCDGWLFNGSNSVYTGSASACNADGTFKSTAQVPKVTNGGPAVTSTTLVPRNLNSGSFVQTEERKTYQLAMQWRPLEDLEFNLSGYYVDADDSSYQQALLTDVGASWDDQNGAGATRVNPANTSQTLNNYPTNFTTVTTNQYGVTGGTLSMAAVRLDMSYNRQILQTKALNLQGKWTPGQWKIEANIGDTKATGGTDPQYYLSFYGHTSVEYSLTANSSYLKTGTPLTDPTLFKSQDAGQQSGFVKTSTTNDEIKYAKIDFQRDVSYGWVNKFEFGVRYQQHLNSNVDHYRNTYFKKATDLSAFSYITTPTSLVDGLGASGDLLSYVYLSKEAVVDYMAPDSSDARTVDHNIAGYAWDATETDAAAYVQADFRAGRFHGDAGVRAVNTETSQNYFSSQNYYPWIGDVVHSKHEYTDILPSANIVYDLDDKQDLRFTVARVMARPTFQESSGQVTYDIQKRVGGGGNPNLGPYRATNFGASYENYFAPNSIFSVDVFLRDIDQYTIQKDVITSVVLPPATLTYCAKYCPGVTSPVDLLLTTPYNGNNAKVTGVSVSYQGEIAWGFGIQTNVTWLGQEYGTFNDAVSITGTGTGGKQITTTLNNSGDKYPLPYLSKWSYTIAPYYEKGPISAHLSYTWRSNYSVRAGSATANPTYTSAYGQLDGSIAYSVNSHLQLTASATNLLDPLVQPFTTGNLPLGWQKYGSRFIVGLNYKFN